MQRTAGFLFNDEGPALIEALVRESTSAPGRLKVLFVAEVREGTRVIAEDKEFPAPADALGHTLPVADEFRLEMN